MIDSGYMVRKSPFPGAITIDDVITLTVSIALSQHKQGESGRASVIVKD